MTIRYERPVRAVSDLAESDEQSAGDLSAGGAQDPSGGEGRIGRYLGPYLVFLLVIGAILPWRSKSYFEGSFDFVVVLKGIISLVALGLAIVVGVGRQIREVRAFPIIFLLMYLGASVLGSWNEGVLVASATIAFRVALLATTVTVLMRRFDGQDVLTSLLSALGTFSAVASISGIGSLASGRLSGGLPPLHPNELASITAMFAIGCFWKCVIGTDHWYHVIALAFAALVLVATGSRTALAVVALALVVLIVQTQALRLRTALTALVAAPVILWTLTMTDTISQLFLRGQAAAQLTTLSNRTIAWRAALASKDSLWQQWVGGGLSTKRIEVPGRWWNSQILDSSWVSAVVQSGLIGMGACVLWVLYAALATKDSPRTLRCLQLALFAYLVPRAFLESGLFDATTAFLAFFTVLMASPAMASGSDRATLPGQGLLRWSGSGDRGDSAARAGSGALTSAGNRRT